MSRGIRLFPRRAGLPAAWLLLALAGPIVSCDDTSKSSRTIDSEAAPPGAAHAAVPSSNDGQAAAQPEPTASPADRERNARELMREWLRAQNEGDFAAYSKLYARKMLGIKRSGPRTRRFERASWLEDRRGMFEKPVVVEATELQTDLLPATIVVSFVQRWSSARYKDVGPKRLVLVFEDGHWRITREEMLRSAVVGSEAVTRNIPARRFAFAESVGGHSYLLLRQHVDAAWAASAPRALGVDQVAAESDVDLERVPAELRALGQGSVRLYGPEGNCDAKVEGLRLFGAVRADWPGDFIPRPDDGPLEVPPSEAARAVMRLGGPHLAARLDRDCGWMLWGQWTDGPAPRVLEALPGTRAVTPALDAAEGAFMREPEYAKAQKRWEDQRSGERAPEPNAKWTTDAQLRRTAWGHSVPELVTMSAGYETCGNYFDAHLLGAYAVTNGGVKPWFKQEDALTPLMVFDLELDGEFEILLMEPGEGLRLVSGAGRPAVTAAYSPPRFGCGC